MHRNSYLFCCLRIGSVHSAHKKHKKTIPHLSHPDLTLLSRDFKMFFFISLFCCRCLSFWCWFRMILHPNVYDHVAFCPYIEQRTNSNIPIYFFFSTFFCFVLFYFSVGNFQVTIYGSVVVKKQKFEKNDAPKNRQKIKEAKKNSKFRKVLSSVIGLKFDFFKT